MSLVTSLKRDSIGHSAIMNFDNAIRQAVANQQIGVGQAQAEGFMNVAGANAGMATNIANSVTGAVSGGLNYMQMQKLIEANRPYTPNYASNPNNFGPFPQ